MSPDILVLFIVVVLSLLILIKTCLDSQENFDSLGLTYVQFPNWFYKKPYNPNDWMVNVYPEHIQPSCLPYSVESKWGSLENMNYNSQAYRFWRY